MAQDQTDAHTSEAGAEQAESEIVLSQERPWPGMRPYREHDATFYFGRGAEVEDLLARTERSLLTLLYARGGLGKTSLLRAGLAPRLVERAYLPVYMRPRGLLDGGRDPVREVVGALEDAARASRLEATADFDAPSLWELFHRQTFDLWDSTNQLVTPVLVFDQFEEIFQVIDDDAGAAPRVRALLDAIAELVENRPPPRLARDDPLAPAGPKFDAASKDFRVILSFREDYLPQMRKLRAIVPSVIENHVRLEPLTGRQALEVVQGAGRQMIDRDAAMQLVQSVGRRAGLLQLMLDPGAALSHGVEGAALNLEVEPSILSVVCFHLNSERQTRGQATIDVGLLKLKSPADIFDDYYMSNVGQLSAGARQFVESSLVTPGGERVLYPMRAVEALGPELLAAVSRLLDQGILRKEWFAGEQRLEISHDLLLRPIKRAIEQRAADASRRRIGRLVAVSAGAALGVIGLIGYFSNMKIQAELEQSETLAEALLVAYAPQSSRNDMAIIIRQVDDSKGAAASAPILEALFDFANGLSTSVDSTTARRIQESAIAYVQLKIERGRFAHGAYPALQQKLRAAVESSCVQGFVFPDDKSVMWFAQRGGVPAACL